MLLGTLALEVFLLPWGGCDPKERSQCSSPTAPTEHPPYLPVSPPLAVTCLPTPSTSRSSCLSSHGLDLSCPGQPSGSQQKCQLVRGIPRPPGQSPLLTHYLHHI